MSKKPPSRGLLVKVGQLFLESIKPKTLFPPKPNLVGRDHHGNIYYEIPAQLSKGQRRPRRWFTSEEIHNTDVRRANIPDGFDRELPSEWEAWLRHRRDDPPTQEMIMQSEALADLKKRNAADLELKRIEELKAEGRYTGPPKALDHEKRFFPKYDEYEVMAGEDMAEKDRWKDFKNPYLSDHEDHVTVKKKEDVKK